VLSGSAQARIPEGNGTRPPSRTVVDEQQAPQRSRTFFVDPVYASLDPAIRIAIVRRFHAAPLAAKAARTGKGSSGSRSSPSAIAACPRTRAPSREEDGAAAAPSSCGDVAVVPGHKRHVRDAVSLALPRRSPGRASSPRGNLRRHHHQSAAGEGWGDAPRCAASLRGGRGTCCGAFPAGSAGRDLG